MWLRWLHDEIAGGDGVSENVCLVSVCTGDEKAGWVDLTLPAGVPLASFLPEVVGLAAPRPDGSPGDWQLSRLDGSAFDHQMSLRELEVRNGDLLMLTTSEPAQPVVDRDDWVSRIVASSVETLTGTEYLMTFGSVLAVLGALLCGLLPAGGPVPMVIVAVLLGGAALSAFMAARSYSAAAGPLSTATMVLAAVAGVRAVPGTLSQAHVLLAVTAAAVTALVCLRCRIGNAVVSIAVACCAALSVLAVLVAVSVALPTRSAAALLTVLSLAVLSGAPRLSLMLAGLASAAIDPEPSADADERAGAGQRVLAGLVSGASTAVALGSVTAAAATARDDTSWIAAALLCAASGLILLLRARTFASGRLRWALAINGTCCTASSLVAAGWSMPQYAHWVGAASVCVGVAAMMSVGRDCSSPFAMRALDIVEYGALASVPPLVCAVMNLYGLMRHLSLT